MDWKRCFEEVKGERLKAKDKEIGTEKSDQFLNPKNPGSEKINEIIKIKKINGHPSIIKTKSSLGTWAHKTNVFSISAVRLGPVTVLIMDGSWLPYLALMSLKPSLRSITICEV